ncbi:MAG: ABC transporter ATP-binding protein [Pirellulales bacterium]|nr:ABC transporter ATP-binding protein [Pirellulales bacterium]
MIRVENLHLTQGAFALRGVSLEIADGRYGVLMGASGCGKTTLMEAICGLRRPTSGRIMLADREVVELPPGARQIGYVPQDAALFPGLRVREQLAFGLVVRKRPQEEIRARVDELADNLGVAHLLDRMPDMLSGGEKQRVALGRALAARPKILCLDEPLSTLDDKTHTEIVALLKRMADTHSVTTLHITHSYQEAEQLADTIYVMDQIGLRSVEDGERLNTLSADSSEYRTES